MSVTPGDAYFNSDVYTGLIEEFDVTVTNLNPVECIPFSYNIAENPVHIHDLHATILHLMGIDHERVPFKSQGRQFRLTDVSGEVVTKLLA